MAVGVGRGEGFDLLAFGVEPPEKRFSCGFEKIMHNRMSQKLYYFMTILSAM
jgi:hypothetical protein